MNNRVVITGLGIVAPNGHGLEEYERALRAGTSGIRKIEKLEELGFRCQVGGVPQGMKEKLPQYFSDDDLFAMNEAMIYGCMAAIDAWRDGGCEIPERNGEVVDWDAGCVLGSGLSGIDTVAETLVPRVNAKKVK